MCAASCSVALLVTACDATFARSWFTARITSGTQFVGHSLKPGGISLVGGDGGGGFATVVVVVVGRTVVVVVGPGGGGGARRNQKVGPPFWGTPSMGKRAPYITMPGCAGARVMPVGPGPVRGKMTPGGPAAAP